METSLRVRATRPSLDGVWAAIAVLLPLAATLFMTTQALDLAYHLRAGEVMLDTGTVMRADAFTYTVAGTPWLNQQWGAQVVMAGVYAVSGWGGLNLLRGVAVGLTTYFVYRACRAVGAGPRTASLLTIAGWLVGIQITAMLRPQLFGTALFAACLWILAERHRRPSRLWWIPAIVLFWVNVHGSFPLVFVLLLLAGVEDRRDRPALRRLLWVGLACLGATVLSPFGWRTWTYVLDLMRNPVVRDRVAEWEPTSIDTFAGIAFFASVLGVLVLIARRPVVVGWPRLAGLVVFAIIGVTAYRGIAWWAMVAPVVVAGILADRSAMGAATTPTRDAERSPLNLVVIVVLAALCVIAASSLRGMDPRSGGPAMLSAAPESLVAAVRSSTAPGSRVFASQLFSSWMEFSAPEYSVPVDARIELYPEQVWDDYFTVSSGSAGWQSLLERDDVQALIIAREQSAGLLDELNMSSEWALLLETADGAAYARV